MNIHFIGIRGVSMARLADFCRRSGASVSGSDKTLSGHSADNVRGADLVVYTGAVGADNPERAEAARLHIPTLSRAELLGRIAAEFPCSVGVAGCHGKTTTTALIGHALTPPAPEVHVGGDCAFPAGSGIFVTEACEYQRSFLQLKPSIAVVLNVALDHTDCYRDIDDAYAAFYAFAASAGKRIVNGDDRYCRMLPDAVTFGLNERCTYRAADVRTRGGLSFDLLVRGRYVLTARLPLVGRHNVYNALAAFAVADTLGVPPARALLGMCAFHGVGRRFERVGTACGAAVYTDYAHHPDEIAATIAAAREQTDGRLIAVFEPHTYTRTQAFLSGFVDVLAAADEVALAPVYAAREEPIPGVCSSAIGLGLQRRGCRAAVFDTYCALNDYVRSIARPNDLILYLGAGSIDTAAQNLCE